MADKGFLSEINVVSAVPEFLLHNTKSFAMPFKFFFFSFSLSVFLGRLTKIQLEIVG